MRKTLSKVILILCLPILAFTMLKIFTYYEAQKACHGGRDTVIEFGDECRYAILSGKRDNKVEWTLYDRNRVMVIDENVYSYFHTSSNLYTIGTSGFTEIDYINGQTRSYKSLDDISKNDYEIFMKLNNKEIGIHKD
jgi:hypothetical protein